MTSAFRKHNEVTADCVGAATATMLTYISMNSFKSQNFAYGPVIVNCKPMSCYGELFHVIVAPDIMRSVRPCPSVRLTFLLLKY